MRQQRIQYAFAFDVHFRTAGFLRIPVDVRPPMRGAGTGRAIDRGRSRG